MTPAGRDESAAGPAGADASAAPPVAGASVEATAAERPLLPPGADPGEPLPLLADPGSYRACEHDLLADPEGRAYWLELFATHVRVQLDHARAAEVVDEDGVERAAAAMRASMDAMGRDPARHGRLDILVLDSIRRRVLADAGIADEFRLVKARENARALRGLAARCARLDAMDPRGRAHAVLEGLLAGNLFDMGAAETAARFGASPPRFEEVLDELPPRPWHRDDAAAAADVLVRPPRRTLVLVDNAGADVVLGALPLARAIVHAGGRVVLAANAAPSLNDVTAAELHGLLALAARTDPVFASDAIAVVDSGSHAPLIDLGAVSAELAEAARHPELGLLVLLGMGRAIESNWTARFRVPVLRVAMLKDPQVARRIGGSLPGAVVRLDGPAAG